MKITMYELLGMIKDGKAPKLIKYDGMIWEYDGDYYSSKNNVTLEEYCNLTTSLNDEVEILEEEKKIPKKLPYYSLEKIQKAKNKDEWREERISLLEKRIDDYHNKTNEILDYLKEIE